MTTLARIAALLLAAVFVIAAGAKLRRPEATVEELNEIGLRAPRALAWLLPLAELGAAAALVVTPNWGGVVSFALLAAFSVVLVRLVRSGRPVACRCFGGYSTKPVSPLTLVRNGGLLVLAALAAAG